MRDVNVFEAFSILRQKDRRNSDHILVIHVTQDAQLPEGPLRKPLQLSSYKYLLCFLYKCSSTLISVCNLSDSIYYDLLTCSVYKVHTCFETIVNVAKTKSVYL